MFLDGRDTPADIGPDAPARAGPMSRFARAVLASGAILIPGVLLLLVGLLHGIGASGCTSADQLAGWPGRG